MSDATDLCLDIIPQPIVTLVEQLREAANQEGLSRNARLKTVSAVRRAIVPRRTPGKKKTKGSTRHTPITIQECAA